jgi:hypothetical protein
VADQKNPFKEALEKGPARREEGVKPFFRGEPVPNPRKLERLRTVADLQLVDKEVLDRTPKIRDLTVHDLNDLAEEFSGIPTNNPRVSDLTLEDIQDLEGVFFEFKIATGRDMIAVATGRDQIASARPVGGTSVDVSCCCCTPCCCCAAADMSHSA